MRYKKSLTARPVYLLPGGRSQPGRPLYGARERLRGIDGVRGRRDRGAPALRMAAATLHGNAAAPRGHDAHRQGPSPQPSRSREPSRSPACRSRTPPTRDEEYPLRLQHVTINGHDVAYRTAGDGPVVLLVHGMAGSSATWNHVMPTLARRFTVVAPDLLGHGESAKPRGEYSLGAHANSLRDLLNALGSRPGDPRRPIVRGRRGHADGLPVPGAL